MACSISSDLCYSPGIIFQNSLGSSLISPTIFRYHLYVSRVVSTVTALELRIPCPNEVYRSSGTPYPIALSFPLL